ncbi:DnaJ C-terminal domain-containing protein [Legionella anisa]|uniref:Cytochrome C biogenesis protein n=1 Tax=Legionella anisa TaxID=28082 RepID=A0AAX0WSK7_9GAMM|nr:DnaJ C-terminal domain-containing protein [Legionella anisa]AWN74809.1 cytochrome C biogenesis protein [Legionella anisa]KTC77614.1 DNA-binding protein DnaJ [Legionella anisa]MBN5936418.1 DnaJ domain-containing protein [Legionella anisa]MCW8425060.1 DnaJ domain-containing protein [Legionella anisa]MCW8445824.1 DnaJ domain-containing protein [Legionella anisa]
MDKDYYKIMGVSEDASDKDIKMAYRKLARKYHPDISKEPNAEERFKEMGEAYEVLRDPVKRAEYDKYRKNKTFHQQETHTHWRPEQSEHVYSGQFNEDLFETLFGHSRYRQQPIAGQDYHGKINISLEEAFTGTVKNIQVPIEQESNVTTQTLKVKIPAGVKSGQQIRLAGQGAPGIHEGPRGDIYLTVHVNKHSLFDVMDSDIYLTLPITPWEAALGATIVVPTLGGKIDLKIPPGSQGGQKLRLKNRGLPGATPGHQYVLLKMITPPPKTEAAIELYKKMAQVMPFNPRDKMGA